MPVVHIRGSLSGATADVLAKVARDVAAAIPCSVGDVWCTYHQVTATVGTRSERVLYVDLLARPREDGALVEGLEAAARAASAAFHVSLEDVWGHLTVLEEGSVFAGGGLL
jgi:hypothetical protein